MGIEHALICKKCNTWVDGHKCWGAYLAVHDQQVPSWEEIQKDRTAPFFDLYWTWRMFAFLWKHKNHGNEVVWVLDSRDDYCELIEGKTEELYDRQQPEDEK